MENPCQLPSEALRELEAKGLCFCTDSVAEAWVCIARNLLPDLDVAAAQARAATPHLIEEGFREFNLVAYGEKVFAVAQSAGPTDLTSLSTTVLKELRGKEQIYVADSAEEARCWIEQFHERRQPRLLAPAYRGFDLIAYRDSIWAVAEILEPLDLTVLSAEEIEEHQRTARLFVASSVEEARRWIDEIGCRPRRRSLFSTIYRLAADRFCR